MGWRFAIAFLAAVLAAGQAFAEPKRIVSTHLCADQLLLLLADRDRIAALSYFATDRALSYLAAEAEGFRRTRGLAEELAPLKPDLALVGKFAARPTTALLHRIGVPTLQLDLAETFDDVRKNIRIVAEALGEPERGVRLIEAFDRELLSVTPATEDRPTIALYWAHGYMPASVSLAAEAVRRAGFQDLGASLDDAGPSRLSVESLLLARPDLLATAARGPKALAGLPTSHKALQSAFPADRRIAIPDRLWICGAPFVAEAVKRLAARRSQF